MRLKYSFLPLALIGVYLFFYLCSPVPWSNPEGQSRFHFAFSILVYPEFVQMWWTLPETSFQPAVAQALAQTNTSWLPMTFSSVLFISAFMIVWVYALGDLGLMILARLSRLGFNKRDDTCSSAHQWYGQPLSASERFVLLILIGIILLMTMTVLLGGVLGPLFGLKLLTLPIYGTIAVITILTEIFIKARHYKQTVKLNQARSTEGSFSGRFFLVLGLAAMAFLIVMGALTPPWEFDAREYHFEAAKQFYQTGQIGWVENNVYANMPLGAEMLILTGMVLAGDFYLGAIAGKVVLAMTVFLTAMLITILARRISNTSYTPLSGWLGAIIYLSVPLVIQNAQFGLVDNFSALWTIAIIYSLYRFYDSRPSFTCESWFWLVITAMFVGAALSVKYTTVVFTVLPAVAVVAWLSLSRSFHFCENCSYNQKIKTVVMFGVLLAVVALAVCGFWYVKNAFYTGNPVYPLASSIFPMSMEKTGFTELSLEQWRTVHRSPGFDFVRLFQQYFFSWDWGPLIVPVSILGLVFGFRHGASRILATYITVYFIGWLVLTHQIDRFLLPVFPLLSLLGGLAIANLQTTQAKVCRQVMAGFLGYSVVYVFVIISVGGIGDNVFFASMDQSRAQSQRIGESLESYLTLIKLGLVCPENEIEKPQEDKRDSFGNNDPQNDIVLIGDAAVFDWPVPIRYAVCFHSQRYWDQLTKEWNQGRWPRVIIVNFSEIERYRQSGYGYTDDISETYFDQLVQQGLIKCVYLSDDKKIRIFITEG